MNYPKMIKKILDAITLNTHQKYMSDDAMWFKSRIIKIPISDSLICSGVINNKLWMN